MKLPIRLLVLAALGAWPQLIPAQSLPPLDIQPIAGGGWNLSWPDPGETLFLESSVDVGQRATWTKRLEEPVLTGGRWSANVESLFTKNYFRLRRPDLAPPSFPAPAFNPTLPLGTSASFRLSATDLSQPVTFSVEPNPLPEGATLDTTTGDFYFRPVEGMSGPFTFDFYATDPWGNRTLRTVTLNVTLPPAGTPTAVTGFVLDTNSAVGGNTVPIVGAVISLLNTGSSVATNAQGAFTLNAIPGGLQVLDINVSGAQPGPGGALYAGFREKIRLINGVMNVVERPFYLPRLDESSLTPVVPGQTTGVINPNLNIAMTVPPDTANADGGGDFTGQLSISPVPQDLAPAELPDELGRGSLITIQPVGVSFDTPVPITFPNRDNLPPGSDTDLWSLDPKSGTFVIVGTGRVTPDGQFVETVSGGIRAADWHDIRPPQPCPENGGDDPNHHDPKKNCNGQSGSEVSLHTGGLRTGVELPEWYSANRAQRVQLVYNSRFAYPYIIVPYNAVNSARAAVPRTISQSVSLGGAAVPFSQVQRVAAARSGRGGAAVAAVRSSFFYDTTRLSESIDEVIRMAFGFDGSDMETGSYPYRALVMSNYPTSSIGASFNRRCTIINESKSAFGAGWSIAGLQKLYPVADDPNRVLVVDGDGAHYVFTKGATDQPFTIGGLSAARSGAHSFADGASYGTARSAIQTAFPQVTFAGLDTLNTASLAQLDILVLSPITGPTTATALSAAEQTALFNWVRDGGCALICVDNDLGRATFNTADESMIAPFGVTSENSSGDVVFVSPENSPITSGIFGDVPRYTRAFGGRKVISPGNWGRSIAIDPQGGIGLVEVPGDQIQDGSGQVLVVTDTHLFLNNNAGGQISEENHRILLLNAIDSFLTTQEPPGADIVLRGPKGEFSRLLKKPDGTYVREYVGGDEARFSVAGRLTSFVDRNGETVTWSYDANGRVTGLTDIGGRTATFQYGGSMLSNITDPAGRTTTFTHDADGDLTRITLPGGASYDHASDDRHLIIRSTRPDNFTVDREYDGCGRLLRTVWPDGSQRNVVSTQSKVAPAPGLAEGSEETPAPVIRSSDVSATFDTPQGRVTAKTDNLGQEIDVTAPGGRTIIDRDANGLPTRRVLPTGETFRYKYNRNGQEIEREDVTFGGRVQRGYHLQTGDETSYTDEFNQTWTAQYDNRGNRTRVTTPAGRITNNTYNARGQILSMIPADRPAGVFYAYDAGGNLASITIGAGAEARTTTFTYDAAGQLASSTNPLGQVTSFQWSPLGRVTSVTLPDANVVATSLDAIGRMLSLTPPGRPAHQVIRDDLGRAIEYRPPVAGRSIFFEYDAFGLSRGSSGDRSIRHIRNAGGMVTAVQVGRGSYTYDYANTLPVAQRSPDGIIENVTWRGSEVSQVVLSGQIEGTLKTSLDEGRRVTGLQLNSRPVVTFGFDADDLITSAGALTLTRHAATGSITGTTLGVVSETFVVNAFGEVTGHNVTAGGNPVATFTLTRDRLGRIVAGEENFGGTVTTFAYIYDSRGRLTAATRNGTAWFSCQFDANGNRTSFTGPGGTRAATFDVADQILTDGADTFTHNAAGQRTGRSGATNMTLNPDEHGMLLGATVGPNAIEWRLSASGRPSVKQVNGVRARAFLWGSYVRPQAELDGANQVLAEYVHAVRANVPDYIIRDGVNYRLVTDTRGSVRLVIDATTGAVMQRIDYNPWGEVMVDSNPGFQPFGFAGGLLDPDTGFVLFGLREYDPSTARFISRDPVLFDGGDTNLYAYCTGDPVNLTDITGTAPNPQEELEKKLKDLYGEKVKDEILKRVAKRAGFASIGSFLAGSLPAQKLAQITTGWMSLLLFEGYVTTAGADNPYNPATDPDPYTEYLLYYWVRTGTPAI